MSECKNTIQYTIGEDVHDFTWRGKYTHGWSSCKGTRVWLTKHAGVRHYLEDGEWFYQQESEQDEMDLLHGSEIFSRDGYMDAHNIRAEKPTKCIDQWFKLKTPKELNNYMDNLLINQGIYIPNLPDLTQFNSLLIEEGSGKIIWYGMYDLLSTQEELLKVEQLGEQLGISFEWY